MKRFPKNRLVRTVFKIQLSVPERNSWPEPALHFAWSPNADVRRLLRIEGAVPRRRGHGASSSCQKSPWPAETA